MNKWRKQLIDTLSKDQIVEIDRNPIDKEHLRGYVLDASDNLLLIHVLSDHMFLDGYSVIRDSDIKRWRVIDDWDFFANRALKIKGDLPVRPNGVNLDSLKQAIVSANDSFPLIAIHREQMDNTVCFIGKTAKVTDKTVTLDEINPGAEWKRSRRYNFRDISKIDFGGRYEEALWLVSESERRKGKRKRQGKK